MNSKIANNTLFCGIVDEVADANMESNDANIYISGTDVRMKYKDGTGTLFNKNLGGEDWPVFTTTAPSNTAAAGEHKIINVTSSGNFTLSDSTKVDGNWYTIKDSTGITIHDPSGPLIGLIPESGTIDGESSRTIDGRYGAVTVYTDGTNWFTTGINFSYSDTHSTTYTGPWASPQGSFLRYYVTNNVVHIEIPEVLSNATVSSVVNLGTALPDDLRPRSSEVYGLMPVVDDGNDMLGRWSVDKTFGQIQIGTGPGNTPFTGSGNTGFRETVISYNLFSYNA